MGANPLAVVGIDTTIDLTPTSGTGTVTDTTNLPYALGTVFSRGTRGTTGEKRYKLVLIEDANVASGNVVCYTTDDNGFEVTTDRAGGTSDNNQPAGLALGTVTDGNVGWIQTFGLSDVAVVTDGGVSAGEAVIPHATTNGGLDSSTAGVNTPANVVGQALDADTGTALAAGLVFLDCPKG